MSISANFNMFCDHLKVSAKKESIISLRYNSISKKLNNDFWNINTNYGSIYIGCYGRGTANDGVKKVDMIFEMPSHLLEQYDACGEKCQAKFLEDVRRSIATMYPKTSIDKEKQYIKVQFSDGMSFNIVPAFIKDGGGYFFADLTGKGSWNTKKPISFIEAIKHSDKAANYNLKKLCKMVKAWKQNCNVKIKDVLIDTLVYEFFLSSKKEYKSYSQFDTMCMDFFKFLMDQEASKVFWDCIGSNQKIHNSFNFRYKAIIAYFKAKSAIKAAKSGRNWSAVQKWREVFGYRFPETVKVASQIKKLQGKTVSLYATQKRCVRILNHRMVTFKALQLLTALLTVLGVLIIGHTEKFELGFGLFVLSSITFLVTLYLNGYNLSDISEKHKLSALNISLLKEELGSLLKDLHHHNVDISIIRKRKEELQRKIYKVYKGPSKSVSKKYEKALKKISVTSKIKEKLPTIEKSKVQIPIWQGNKFYRENTAQSLMNYKETV